MDTKVYSDTVAVVRRLKELGLTHDVLANAVTAAYQKSSNCTSLHPKVYRGFTLWAETIGNLRALLPEWQAKGDGNYDVTVSPNGQIAIVVATGDSGTGVTNLVPTTQSSKGPRTVAAVAANQNQLRFQFAFPDAWIPPLIDPAKIGSRATWILLIHQADAAMRAELSLPLRFDAKNRVSGWSERILLSLVDYATLGEIKLNERDQLIDVPVRRRV